MEPAAWPTLARRRIITYRDLDVWKWSMRLIAITYRTSKRFPKSETYGLTSQVRRAAVSVAANIAEGYGRLHRGDYLKFLAIANGSLKELETEILIARDLGYCSSEGAQMLLSAADRVGRMLASLIRRLRAP